MNTSNVTILPNINGTVTHSTSYNYFAACVVALLDVISLLGNALVCFSFYYFRDLRTIPSYFIVSLSIADLMVALFAMPFWFILQLNENELQRVTYIHGAPYDFWNFIDILCGSASIYSLTAVSVDRHFAITSPMQYPRKVTSRRAFILILCLWLFAATIATGCFPQFFNVLYTRKQYMIFISTLSFFLPLLIIIIMYGRIYITARKQAMKMRLRDVRATKTIAVVVGAFIVCWLPFFVIVFGFAINPHFPAPMWVIATIKWLAYLNSAVNPIIYTLLNRSYRKAFRRLCLKCWKPNVQYGEHRRISLSFTTKGPHFPSPSHSHEEDKDAITPTTLLSSEDFKPISTPESSSSSADHLKHEKIAEPRSKRRQNGHVHYEDEITKNGNVWIKRH